MKPIFFSSVKEYDTIIITGTDTEGYKFKDFKCVVSTVSKGDEEDPELYIKVWPDDDNDKQLPDEVHYGKIWFREARVKKVVLIEREAWNEN